MFANLPVTTSAILSVCYYLSSTSVQIFHLAPHPPALTSAIFPCRTSKNQHPYAARAAAHHHPRAKDQELLHCHLLKAGLSSMAFVFPSTYCKIATFPPKPPLAHQLPFHCSCGGNFFSSEGFDPEATFPWLRIFTFSLPVLFS